MLFVAVHSRSSTRRKASGSKKAPPHHTVKGAAFASHAPLQVMRSPLCPALPDKEGPVWALTLIQRDSVTAHTLADRVVQAVRYADGDELCTTAPSGAPVR